MGDIVSSLKKNLGIRTYDADDSSNLSIGSGKFDILCNKYAYGDPPVFPQVSVDGTVYHEAYITDDGTDYVLDVNGRINATVNSVATTIAMTTGEFSAANQWVIARESGEKMWLISWNNATGLMTVDRGQLGTTAAQLSIGRSIDTLGDTLNEALYSKPFKVAAGYWHAIKCISGHDADQGVKIQANNLAGDNISIEASNTYRPDEEDNYLNMYPGDIFYGKFNRVAIDEPSADTEDKAAKILLYRG